MANLFKGVVKLTEDQYQLLKSNGSIVVNGVTIQYDDYTLYVTDYAIDGELDLTSSNPVENKVVTKALQRKADVEDIPQNVVTTIDEQEISGNKSFVGTLKYKNDEVATKSEIPVVSDDLKTEHSSNALSVGQGIILNNTITTLVENVNGRVKSFTVNDLNELGALFDIEINEAKDEYEVTKTSIDYKGKKYDLVTGDIFFVVNNDIPDYWFSLDNMKLYKMETMKVDLSNFYTIAQVDEMVGKKANKTSLDETNKKVEDIEKELEDKVEKEDGKGLSSNDFTTEEKKKLAGIQPGANMNVPSDWNATSGDAAILNKPTKVSEFENDKKFATEDYVNTNGGKIDKIYLNDVEQTITDKEVHLNIETPEMPTDYYKIKNKLTGINLNTIVEPGNYGVANDCVNMPIAENGTLFVGLYQNNQYAQQMFITSSNNIYTRTSKNIENTNWTSWEKFARSSEIPEQIDYSIYDLVIRTQEEFEAWYTSLDNNTSTAKSVLLVGDGIPIYGSQYIRNDGGGLKLNTSDSGIILHGINHPNISIEGFVPTNDCPAAICGTSLDSATSGIGSAIKDINIYVLGENEVSAFYALTHIENCACVVQSALGPAYCFDSCFFVSNIVSIVEGHPMYNTMSFVDCAMITNCLTATSLSGSGEGKAYSYCNCFGISNCVEAYDGNSNNVMYNDGCYLINANLEDIPDVSNFITKDVNNLTYYPTTEELNQRLSQLDVEETDPTVPSYVKEITEEDITNWNNKLDSFTEQDPTVPEYVKEITEQDIINWNNKLSSFTEEDPTVPEYVKEITEEDITNWNNKLGSFTEQDPTVPAHVKAITTDNISNWNSKVDKDVDNLTNYTLSAGVGSKLELSMDETDYILTIKLNNAKGTTLDTKTVNLPLETMVVDASYDSNKKEITLELQNGTTTSFSVADLVSGLVPDTRKVNGKALSDDISLNAGDVGALPDSTTYVSSVNGSSGAISNIATTNSAQSLYKKNFNQITINEGTCSTASSVATKVVTLSNFELKAGAIIDVKFTNASYYDDGTTSGLTLALNVNNTGAKNILLKRSNGGTAISTMGSKSQYTRWYANEVVRFRYDGSYWSIVCNLTSMTNYMRPILGSPIRYNKADGTSTYWYATADLDLTHLLPSTVQYVSQSLSKEQKAQARTNIGAGTSNFSGAYDDLTGKPTIPSIPNISVTDTQSGNAVTDVTSSGHTLTLTRANFLEKITYEYNKEVEVSSANSVNTIGPNAKVCLGKFPCYDSNITIDIKSTTSTPYSGTLVIAMQNIGANTTQTLNAVVYGDPTGAMSSLIYIKMPANNQNTDNIVEVYLNSGRYSKNFIHIKCNGLKATPTDVCTYISSVPSTATVRPTNALTANFANKSDLPSTFVNYVDDIPSSATPNPLLNYVQKSELTSTLSNYLTLNGGTLKGNLTVGSSSIGTNGYIQGTWLKTTADTHLSSTPTQVAVLSNGWIYNRTLEEFKTDLGVGSSAIKVVQKSMQSVSSSTTSTAKLTAEQIELWNRAIAFELAIVKKSSSSSSSASTSSYVFEKHHGGDNYHYCFNPSYGDTFLLCMGVSVNSSGTISAHVSYDLRYKTLIYEDKEYEIPYRKTSFVPGYESGGYIVAYAITKVWVLE